MTQFLESESFALPSQIRKDVAGKLKDSNRIKNIEFQMKGESLEGAKEFSRTLLSLKKRGVKISHEFSIRLDFPKGISREGLLALVEDMPQSKNGFLKVRLEVAGKEPKVAATKS